MLTGKNSKSNILNLPSALLCLLMLVGYQSIAITKTSITSGNFGNPAIWSPAGVPDIGDSVIISSGHFIRMDISAQTGGMMISQTSKLTISDSKKLTISGSITIEGHMEVNDGDIELATPAPFKMGALAVLTWKPLTNTEAGATLFTNGIENFFPTSHLIIKKWYNYTSVPIGKVVTGNFGHLTVTTLMNGLVYEWHQQNYFETQRILGTLTIDQGWVVLDKTGNISNTQIGAIVLQNINSYLDFHEGDVNHNFNVETGSITNIGGTLYGLVNGNGNVHLEVTGDIRNLGNMALIQNKGVSGTSNGNAYMKVGGRFEQTHGDFRGIFNITTLNSGVADLEFNELEVKGGIFMGQYNCHVNGGISKIKVTGDLTIKLTNSTNIFRGAGLSTITGTHSNLQLQLTVMGDLKISGNDSAEVTTSASSGKEIVRVTGYTSFDGCKTSFNYGNHQTEIYLSKDVLQENGELFLSKTSGSLLVEISDNLIIAGGTIHVKSSTGHTNLNIRGSWEQQGGIVNLYYSTSTPANHVVYCTVSGDFSLTGGKLNFSNQPQSTVQHQLSLNGKTFRVGNNAEISCGFAVSNPKYGLIHFDRIGDMSYINDGRNVKINNVVQSISNSCSVIVLEGDFVSPSTMINNQFMTVVNSGGVLDLNNHQIINPNQQTFSNIMIADNGRLRISNAKGLYDGSADAAISSTNLMNYSIGKSGIIEYYGEHDQFVTGTGNGIAQSEHHQYGILEINKSSGTALVNSYHVNVRTTLFLNHGKLDLNGFNLSIHNGKAYGITREKGFIRSEHHKIETNGQILWNNIDYGIHTIPFGISEEEILPLSFHIRTGAGRPFSAATRSSDPDNRPLPVSVTNLPLSGGQNAIDKIIDRWYYIQADGIKADISLSYLGKENTTAQEFKTENFSCMLYNGGTWKLTGGIGKGVIEGTGAVETKSMSNYGFMLLVSNKSHEGGIDPGHGNQSGDQNNIQMLSANPNPFTSVINIEYHLKKDAPVTISLLQTHGREVKRFLVDANAGENKQMLNIESTLPAGMYILNVTDGISSAQKKLVKHQ